MTQCIVAPRVAYITYVVVNLFRVNGFCTARRAEFLSAGGVGERLDPPSNFDAGSGFLKNARALTP